MRRFQNLLLVLCYVIQVFVYEGRGVNIFCPYQQGYEDYEKYFCKGNVWRYCDFLIKASQKRTNKYFVHDDKKLRMLNVNIANTRLDDAGTYWCGVERIFNDIDTEVRLGVIKDSCCDNVTKIQGAEEGSVSIICPYESKYLNNLKYMCRGNQRSTCLQQALITSNTRHNGRVTLNDDKKSNTFTVTIFNLTLEDSGSYLCGVQRESGLDGFSAAELEVKGVFIR
ncbi:CMRF35-like molecule 8 [Nematolebias whitei]|uniref:CMRF35-like molecule 8 n=1 Tax=Nematolebias whitei TaxID=451745 RepID=UPI00189908D2|nr:CMRF35-like molecule 8 [Nematolebias whitei]